MLKFESWFMLNRVFNALGLLISALMVIAIVYWGINLSNLKVEKLPVIKALDGNIREKPDKVIERNTKDLSISRVISETKLPEHEEKITLAPETETLSEAEVEVAILPNTDELDFSEAIKEALRQVLTEENSDYLSIDREMDFKLIFKEAENKKMVEEFYLQLLSNFEERLTNIPYSIENVTLDGREYYRLILTGFKNKSGANDLQMLLFKNGINSEISTK